MHVLNKNSSNKNLVIVLVNQHPPASGAPAISFDAGRQTLAAEDVATHCGHHPPVCPLDSLQVVQTHGALQRVAAWQGGGV